MSEWIFNQDKKLQKDTDLNMLVSRLCDEFKRDV